MSSHSLKLNNDKFDIVKLGHLATITGPCIYRLFLYPLSFVKGKKAKSYPVPFTVHDLQKEKKGNRSCFSFSTSKREKQNAANFFNFFFFDF